MKLRLLTLIVSVLFVATGWAQPSGISPSGSTVLTSSTSFSWTAVTGASTYYLEISRDNAFQPWNVYAISYISGTSASWSPSSASAQVGDTFYWRVKVSNTSSWSSTKSFTYTSSGGGTTYYININSPSSPRTICVGESVTFSGSSNYSGAASWDLPGGTPSTLNSTSGVAVYNTPGVYSIVFKKGSHTITRSNYITVKPLPSNNVITATNNGRICPGGQVTLTEGHTHITGDTYQWLMEGNAIQGATDSVYIATAPGNYSLMITSDGCSNVSNVIAVQPFNTDLEQTSPAYYCAGYSAPLVCNTGVPGCSYTWYNDAGLISGQNDSILNVSTSGNYYVIGDLPGGGCPTTSATVSVSPNTTFPTALISQGTTFNLCNGDTLMINANSDANYTYRWFQGGNIIPAATDSALPIHQPGQYIVEANYHNCLSYDTIVASIVANPTVTIEPTTSCNGLNQFYRANSPSANTFTWSTGEQGDSIYPLLEDTIRVLAIDNNGCDTEVSYITDPCYCMSGEYMVGPNSNIPDLASLNLILDNPCTMTGAATFKFESGEYPGRIYQSANVIPGNSIDKPVIFESASGNAADVTIKYDQVNGSYGCMLFKAQYMKLKNMSFSYPHDDYTRMIVIGNTSAVAANTYYEVDNIHAVGNDIGGIQFNNARCKLSNSSFDCTRYEDADFNDCEDVEVINNELRHYDYPLYISRCKNVHVSGNRIYFDHNNSSLSRGITISNCTGATKVEKNLIQVSRGSGIYYSEGNNPIGNTVEISNNMICLYTESTFSNSSTLYYGIGLFSIKSPTKIYHNSISNWQKNVSSNPTTEGIYVKFDASFGNNTMDIRNNIFSGNNTQLHFIDHDFTYNITLDYNDYWQAVNGDYPFIINTTAYTNFNAFRGNTPYEDHGVSKDPMFVQPGFNSTETCNLHTGNAQLKNIADPSAGVFDDYDSHARYLPDIGADEIDATDIAITNVQGISPSSCFGNYNFSNDSIITVTLRNNGNGFFPAGFPIVVSCMVNNVVQVSDTIPPVSNWAQGDTITHTFSQAIHLLPNGPNDIMISTGHYDNVPGNDIVNQLAGNFTPPVADFNVSSRCQNAAEFENISTTTDGTLSYHWDFGDGGTSSAQDPTYSYSSSGNQTVTLVAISNTGCKDTTEQVVNVYPVPNVSLASFGTVCVYHEPFNLTNGSPSGGTYSGDGVDNGYFNPGLAGLGYHVITYTYTTTDGCADQSSVVLQVSACTGVEEYDLGDLKVYPNPTNGILNIELLQSALAGNYSNGDIRVVDLRGQLVYSSSLKLVNNTKVTLDLGEVSPGVYFLELNIGQRKGTTKLVISE